MNGQMKNYEKYIKSLNSMQEPKVPKAKIDMRGAMRYAAQKGSTVENLDPKDRKKFIQFI